MEGSRESAFHFSPLAATASQNSGLFRKSTSKSEFCDDAVAAAKGEKWKAPVRARGRKVKGNATEMKWETMREEMFGTVDEICNMAGTIMNGRGLVAHFSRPGRPGVHDLAKRWSL